MSCSCCGGSQCSGDPVLSSYHSLSGTWSVSGNDVSGDEGLFVSATVQCCNWSLTAVAYPLNIVTYYSDPHNFSYLEITDSSICIVDIIDDASTERQCKECDIPLGTLRIADAGDYFSAQQLLINDKLVFTGPYNLGSGSRDNIRCLSGFYGATSVTDVSCACNNRPKVCNASNVPTENIFLDLTGVTTSNTDHCDACSTLPSIYEMQTDVPYPFSAWVYRKCCWCVDPADVMRDIGCCPIWGATGKANCCEQTPCGGFGSDFSVTCDDSTTHTFGPKEGICTKLWITVSLRCGNGDWRWYVYISFGWGVGCSEDSCTIPTCGFGSDDCPLNIDDGIYRGQMAYASSCPVDLSLDSWTLEAGPSVYFPLDQSAPDGKDFLCNPLVWAETITISRTAMGAIGPSTEDLFTCDSDDVHEYYQWCDCDTGVCFWTNGRLGYATGATIRRADGTCITLAAKSNTYTGDLQPLPTGTVLGSCELCKPYVWFAKCCTSFVRDAISGLVYPKHVISVPNDGTVYDPLKVYKFADNSCGTYYGLEPTVRGDLAAVVNVFDDCLTCLDQCPCCYQSPEPVYLDSIEVTLPPITSSIGSDFDEVVAFLNAKYYNNRTYPGIPYPGIPVESQLSCSGTAITEAQHFPGSTSDPPQYAGTYQLRIIATVANIGGTCGIQVQVQTRYDPDGGGFGGWGVTDQTFLYSLAGEAVFDCRSFGPTDAPILGGAFPPDSPDHVVVTLHGETCAEMLPMSAAAKPKTALTVPKPQTKPVRKTTGYYKALCKNPDFVASLPEDLRADLENVNWSCGCNATKEFLAKLIKWETSRLP